MSIESFAANAYNVAVSALLTPNTDSEIELHTGDYVVIKGGPTRLESPVGREAVEKPGESRKGPVEMARKPKKEKQTVAVTSNFKLIFKVVTGITIGAGIAQIVLAVGFANPTPNVQSVFDGMGFAWKTGIGAIFGLLGGKVLN